MIYHCYPHFAVLKRSIHAVFRAPKCLYNILNYKGFIDFIIALIIYICYYCFEIIQ